jgi:hypothetical protein
MIAIKNCDRMNRVYSDEQNGTQMIPPAQLARDSAYPAATLPAASSQQQLPYPCGGIYEQDAIAWNARPRMSRENMEQPQVRLLNLNFPPFSILRQLSPEMSLPQEEQPSPGFIFRAV